MTYISLAIDINTQYEEDRLLASVVNHHLVRKPTIRKSGFDLLR